MAVKVNDVVIELDNVSKFFKLYDSPRVRLKEALHPFGKKYHKEFYALNNINLHVERGEVLGIVGRNGSGKSTLLKIIANVLVPSSGRITVNGKINALLELGSGLNPQFTGLQNIYFMGSINGISQDDMEEKVEEIISFSELGEFIHQPLKNYSSGMKAKLAFALATTMLPEILILDEVLSVGDALFRRKSFARMEQLIAEDRTVLFVSHNEQSIKSICTKAILLDKGQLLYVGKPDDTINLYLELLHSKDKGKLVSKKIVKKNLDGFQKDVASAEEELILTKSRKYVRIHNADIKNVDIISNIDGKTVKLFEKNVSYIIRITTKFYEVYDNVSVAMTIKNEKGIIITGISPRLAGQELKNNKNSMDKIFCYTFNCLLLPSTYFIDVSVMGDVEGVNEILCYIRDGYALKVIGPGMEEKGVFGVVDLLEETLFLQ